MARRKKGNRINGWIALDKPAGMTSTQAVGKVKWLFQAQKAGHAGTLDPLATGVLPIALGEATKTVSFAVDGDKAYEFAVRWGAETTTDDSEGEVTRTSEKRPTLDHIEALLPHFTGTIQQVPPQFSAIKVDGNRAYDLARDGEEVELKSRPVEVYLLRVLDQPDAETTVFEAECGKGTYVRAIARDLGRALGCYGHVIALRRTQVGCFDIEDTVPLVDLVDAADEAAPPVVRSTGEAATAADPAPEPAANGGASGPAEARAGALRPFLLPVEAALEDLERVEISPSDASRLNRGQGIIMRGRDAPIATGTAYAICRGRVVAIGELEQGEFRPTRVFNFGPG